MSVAAPTSPETTPASQPASLWVAGLAGGVFILAALAVVFYGVPQLWHMGISSWLVPLVGGGIDGFFRVVAQVAVAVFLGIFGMNLAGPHPQQGLRGAIFLAMTSVFVGFFLVRGLLATFERMAAGIEVGHFFSLAFFALCLFFFYKFLASDRFQRWSIGLEAAGWFSLTSYKRNQGLKVRRMTILGIIIVLGSGVYTLIHNRTITSENWTVTLPFVKTSILLIPNAPFMIPLLLVALTIWFAWRVVNFPVFADFLIATEAEINKVSWTPRARLIQDTIVVLITLFIITAFLFVVDVFWGKLLSREIINVLPTDAQTRPNETKQVNSSEW
ncbi:MAG: preprotein translocase subunit SecE [Planctomycetes bacterium]|nr:preprotein translocase subunit SecE [Planctomycetota bacterium]